MASSAKHKDDVECSCVPKREPLIHVHCASHTYADGTRGIHNICLAVYPDEILAICGPNGSGKSTLLEHLVGLMFPEEGGITIMGKEITEKTAEFAREHVGIVFQDAENQLFAPTVLEDVMFGLLNKGLKTEEAKRRALEALKVVGMEGQGGKAPHYLSGGQKRLAAIAGTLAMGQRVLLVDEPTSDLDPVNSKRIEELLKKLKGKGITVVIAVHDMDLAARIADRIIILKSSIILAEGTPKEIFYNESLLRTASLEQPQVVRTYLKLKSTGKAKDGLAPLTEEELWGALV